MPTILPFVPGDPEQLIKITLDDTPYVLRARWNTRDDGGAWYLDAWELDGTTPIAFGIKLVLGVLLGETYSHPLFLGGMFLVDESGTGAEPKLGDLGGRVIVIHMTATDAALSEAAA